MATVLPSAQPRSRRGTPRSTSHYNSDSPRKRRKYVPGGPGGGGRWIEEETLVIPSVANPRSYPDKMRVPSTPATAARPRRERPPDKPTYNSAADAAAAAAQVDGYKPREERGWEEFHPDLDLDTKLVTFSANDIDGVSEDQRDEPEGPESTSDTGKMGPVGISNIIQTELRSSALATPTRRRPGRPPRRPESMLNGLGSPPAQRIVPLPAQNPRERLTLPKPSYREVFTFQTFEADKNVQENYVNKTLKNAGYQESELFEKPRHLIRLEDGTFEGDLDIGLRLEADGDPEDLVPVTNFCQVEYDMDEQDGQWLECYNLYRKEHEEVDPIRPAVFEVTMTQIEKEWHALEKRIPKPNPKPPQTHRPRSSSSAAVNGEPAGAGEEHDSKCAICDDGDCENTNAIVFCDGCDLAVHQECYGVPFIPEGQWLCRKCQQVGRGTPTCIFCPNTDGAFKLTAESRWAHLLCAIWIPEVTLGNHTFMEPIMEVAAVPKQRWKLVCYICNQRMGACIQCGNKNCYQAFHVTCARRAQLYLKMKSAHGGPASIDASILKAFCDRHVPTEWKRERDVDRATAEAKDFYRHEMKGRKWADSQQSALALVPVHAVQPPEPIAEITFDDEALAANTAAGQKRKRPLAHKNIWRLPSGAPVVPMVVITAVENSLARFTLRKKREFVSEACKYWTLKREARRGAALLKRLQLQMETFSTMEITRRDFAAMGAVGKRRLDRRIEFAKELEGEMLTLRGLCEELKKREEAKLKDTELLKNVIDTVYCPITPLLWPVTEKGKRLARPQPGDKQVDDTSDSGRQMFTTAFKHLESRLHQRYYSSVSAFSADLGLIFHSVAGLESVNDAIEAHNLMTAPTVRDESLTTEQKEIKKLAKRIAKAIQPPLEEAMRKEAELIHGKPFESELKDLENAWYTGANHLPVNTQQVSIGNAGHNEPTPKPLGEPEGGNSHDPSHKLSIATGTSGMTADGGALPMSKTEVLDQESDHMRFQEAVLTPSASVDLATEMIVKSVHPADVNISDIHPDTIDSSHDKHALTTPSSHARLVSRAPTVHVEPLTPPRSEREVLAPPTQGGIPWYLEGFSPVGLAICDESYDGLKVRREMSEELSEMDEEELLGLGVDMGGSGRALSGGMSAPDAPPLITKSPVKKRRKWKGFQ